MPPHTHYVEPYAGGLAVLLAKDPEGVSEVVNDLNGDLINFWRVLADTEYFENFKRAIEVTPFSEPHWNAAVATLGLDIPYAKVVISALDFFIRVRQSLAGRGAAFTPLSRKRTRRGMNEQVAAWLTAVEGLPEVHARLKRVVILNRPALDVIRQQDGPDTLFYLDPPYLHETRSTTEEYGEYEMDAHAHGELLVLIRECKGKVMISGYYSTMYRMGLDGWTLHQFDLPNNAASGRTKARKTECLWTNF